MSERRSFRLQWSLACILAAVLAAFVQPAHAGSTYLVSIAPDGTPAVWSLWPSVSENGRYIAFQTSDFRLNGTGLYSVYLRDMTTITLERIDVSSTGEPANSASESPRMSADGRYVAFLSGASNLVPSDTNGTWDAFVRDRVAGTTERVSVSSEGAQGNDHSRVWSGLDISADGRYVAFISAASNLVPEDTNAAWDVFVHDRQTRATERVSVSSTGMQAGASSYSVAISADGRFVAFSSNAVNLALFAMGGGYDVYVRDRLDRTTELISGPYRPMFLLGPSFNGVYVDISGDGRYVAFHSEVPYGETGDADLLSDVFVRDRVTQVLRRISVSSYGTRGDDIEFFGPSISRDGRYVAFDSESGTSLVLGDPRTDAGVFVHDVQTATTTRASLLPGGADLPDISAGGRYVAYAGDDGRGLRSIYLFDRATCSSGAAEDGRLGANIHAQEYRTGSLRSTVHAVNCATFGGTGL